VTRRTTTLLVTSLLIIVLATVGLTLPVPFVALQPGPTTNTLGKAGGSQLISISGAAKTYPASGQLLLTTVSEQPALTLFSAVGYWLSSDNAVVPEELINPTGASQQEQNQQGQADMATSQENAITSALHYLRIPSTVKVASVGKKMPADGKLQPGDVLTAVDGKKVLDSVDLRADISPLKAGSDVTLQYKRAGQSASVVLTTVAAPADDAPAKSIVGITLTDQPPFSIKIGLKGVGGPSAGLMFALGIVDRLEPANLTGGKTIAGTGEIEANGTVDPIGGIQQKLVGARRAGASTFLVPAENCSEASQAVPSGLRLVKVTSLAQAVNALQGIRGGDTSQPGC
jgi:PDZ domain-containing protein